MNNSLIEQYIPLMNDLFNSLNNTHEFNILYSRLNNVNLSNDYCYNSIHSIGMYKIKIYLSDL